MNYEIVYDYLTEPKRAIEKIKLEKPRLLSFLVVFLAVFTQSISNLQLHSFSEGYILFPLALIFLSRLILVFLAWFIFSAVLHFLAQILGGRGEVENLFLALGFSFLPFFFLLPASVLLKFFSSLQVSGQIYLLYGLVNFFLFFLVIRLQLLSLREIYNLSWLQAISSFAIPFFILILGLAFLILTSVSTVFLVGRSFI